MVCQVGKEVWRGGLRTSGVYSIHREDEGTCGTETSLGKVPFMALNSEGFSTSFRTVLTLIMKHLLMQFCPTPVISSPLGPNILLRTLFLITLNLRFTLNVKHQVSHPYRKNRWHYISVYFNLYVFSRQMRKQKILNCTLASIPRLNLPLTSS
jgi:hypothetical protein